MKYDKTRRNKIIVYLDGLSWFIVETSELHMNKMTSQPTVKQKKKQESRSTLKHGNLCRVILKNSIKTLNQIVLINCLLSTSFPF